MALVLTVMYLYTISIFFIASVHFFLYFYFNLVFINRRNGPRYQRYLALCAFLAGEIPEGLILSKEVFGVCVCFLYICVRTDFAVFGYFVV